jgi:hypothetical protein
MASLLTLLRAGDNNPTPGDHTSGALWILRRSLAGYWRGRSGRLGMTV